MATAKLFAATGDFKNDIQLPALFDEEVNKVCMYLHIKAILNNARQGTAQTKNKSSVRKIRLDWQTVGQFYAIVRELNDTAPIFVSKEKKIYNSTLNDVLERHCKAVGIPTISVHGLRHTHASLLLFDGVSIASVAQRLGHSSINTTQKTYLHIIRELENKDIDLIMKSISSLLD